MLVIIDLEEHPAVAHWSEFDLRWYTRTMEGTQVMICKAHDSILHKLLEIKV